jgi:hypothetical protein
MARQGGRVKLKQSDMCLALNMAKMAKESFWRAAIEETKYLIKKPHAKVREENKWGFEFPGYKKGKAAIQSHPAMLRQNQRSGFLLCPNGAVNNPQTHWIRKGTGAPPPVRRRERIPEPTPPPPGTPPASTGNTSGGNPAEICNLPSGYTYLHTALPCAEYFEDDENTEHHTNFDPDKVNDEG